MIVKHILHAGMSLVTCLLFTVPSAYSTTASYTYDAGGRLTHATFDDGPQISYAYDANGNLLVREIAFSGETTYTLIYTAGSGGFIDGVATQRVVTGGSGTSVEAVTNLYFNFLQWSDGNTNRFRMATNVTEDLTVAAEFAEILADAGTPLWWLAGYGYTNDQALAESRDDDSDGFTARQEFIAGTDPRNRSSAFAVASQKASTGVQLSWSSVSGRVYSVWQSSNLVDWAVTPGQGAIAGDGSEKILMPPAVGSRQFFRIKVGQP